MRRTLLALTATAALLAGGPVTRAEGDPRAEARMLYFDGKFAEAETLLKEAGPEVANDAALRAQLAEAAQKFLRGKSGEDRRAALEAIKRNFAAVLDAKPGDGAALGGAITAAKELVDLDLAKRKVEAAAAQASWSIQLGEKAAAAGGLTPETKAALGVAHGVRASVSKKVDQIDQNLADFQKGARLLEEAAAGHEKESAWLGEAADLRLREATFVHDAIPLETEKRDDAALAAAITLARRACEAKDAADAQHWMHLRALTLALEWKLPGDHGRPFVKPLTPPVQGLELMVPKGVAWTREPGEWDLAMKRQYEGEVNGVQILLEARDAKSALGGRQWAQIAEVVPILFENRQGGFGEIQSEQKPVALGGDKKGKGAVWHFQIAGTVKDSTRTQRLAEWVWVSTTRKDAVWDLKVLDRRKPSSVEDPDLVAFVTSAIGPGLWPPSAVTADEGKKKPGKKK
jgi:hypothetical protein